MIRRLLSIVLCLAVLVSAAACTAPEKGKGNGASSQVSSEQAPERYTFNPKVCCSYMEDVYGKKMCDAWFALVDAVLAGENSFPCPDEHTFLWVIGQFPDRCFPPLCDVIVNSDHPDNNVIDGVGYFNYAIPYEELKKRIEDFQKLVEDILNEVLEPGDSDFEKALALYLYFADTYTYDYDAANTNDIQVIRNLSAYRAFTEKKGICQEFSVAYSYLLMQVGIDASCMSGHRSYDNMPHQWSYIKLNGKNYHVDPTYVLGSHSLSYFLMTDEQRDFEDCYSPSDFCIVSHYSNDHPHSKFTSTDKTFSVLWRKEFVSLDREKNVLTYRYYNEEEAEKTATFSYDGY